LLLLFFFLQGLLGFLKASSHNSSNNNSKNSDIGSVPDPKWHNKQKTELINLLTYLLKN